MQVIILMHWRIDLLTAVGVEINDILETSGQYTTATANFNPNTYP